MEQLAKRYGTALFELAIEENQIDQWQQEAKFIQKSLDASMKPFFVSEQITNKEKKNVLINAFKASVSPRMLDFMCLLIDQHRFTHLQLILTCFNSLCNQTKNRKEGFVYSARPLDESQIQEIELGLSKKYDFQVELTNRIDPRLISGFKIVIDNEVVDTSMKNKIESMRKELIKGVR